jgi:Tfp pilus assembly protein PilF
MPKLAASGVQHAVFTDHSIPRVAATQAGTVAADALLKPFGETSATSRETALAWADVALRENNRAWGMRAFELLRSEYESDPADLKVAAQLAQLYDRIGQEAKACELYSRIVEQNPAAIAPAVNLGACLAKEGRTAESMRLWAGVIRRSPGQEGARLNLAVAQLQTGDVPGARSTLVEALRWNPLSQRAREMLQQLPAGPTPPR